jgi:hypothetical protein
VNKLRKANFKRIVPTHFGVFEDVVVHLDRLDRNLDEIEAWMLKVMPSDPPLEEIHRLFLEWTQEQYTRYGLSLDMQRTYEATNPAWMSPAGLQRYWKKIRVGETG